MTLTYMVLVGKRFFLRLVPRFVSRCGRLDIVSSPMTRLCNGDCTLEPDASGDEDVNMMVSLLELASLALLPAIAEDKSNGALMSLSWSIQLR